MVISIHPEALKAYRARKNWTQAQLSEATRGKNRVSVPTIKRIESAKGESYLARSRVADTLAKALGVKVEDLSQPPANEADREATLRRYGYRPLRTIVDAETALAFRMVLDIYGISIQSQVEMAPLFTALLAEASLAWRRERVEAIVEAGKQLDSLADGHLSFAGAGSATRYSALRSELSSIERRDLFGEHLGDEAFDCGFDPSANNPFADFLVHLATKADAKGIRFDKDLGWKTVEGLPRYTVGADIIDDLIGKEPDGDSEDDVLRRQQRVDAEYALLRGHVRLKEIPDDLRGDERTSERIAWMISRIPEEELMALKQEREFWDGPTEDPSNPNASRSSAQTQEDGHA